MFDTLIRNFIFPENIHSYNLKSLGFLKTQINKLSHVFEWDKKKLVLKFQVHHHYVIKCII